MSDVLDLTPELGEDELTFRARLASVLEHEPYGHQVYFHEGEHDRKFSVSRAAGFVDLYVRTNPSWPFHTLWPAIGIETKIPHRLGWMIDAISQVQRYVEATTARYRIDGEDVPAPAMFLVATPESWESGDVYVWQHPRLITPEHIAGGAIAVTELYDRLLWRAGAAVLRNKYFLSNAEGGPARVYELWS